MNGECIAPSATIRAIGAIAIVEHELLGLLLEIVVLIGIGDDDNVLLMAACCWIRLLLANPSCRGGPR